MHKNSNNNEYNEPIIKWVCGNRLSSQGIKKLNTGSSFFPTMICIYNILAIVSVSMRLAIIYSPISRLIGSLNHKSTFRRPFSKSIYFRAPRKTTRILLLQCILHIPIFESISKSFIRKK